MAQGAAVQSSAWAHALTFFTTCLSTEAIIHSGFLCYFSFARVIWNRRTRNPRLWQDWRDSCQSVFRYIASFCEAIGGWGMPFKTISLEKQNKRKKNPCDCFWPEWGSAIRGSHSADKATVINHCLGTLRTVLTTTFSEVHLHSEVNSMLCALSSSKVFSTNNQNPSVDASWCMHIWLSNGVRRVGKTACFWGPRWPVRSLFRGRTSAQGVCRANFQFFPGSGCLWMGADFSCSLSAQPLKLEEMFFNPSIAANYPANP